MVFTWAFQRESPSFKTALRYFFPSFGHKSPYASESNGVARAEMFICSKLGQNLSGMKVRTFAMIQRVIWDYLMAFKADIIKKQGSF